MARNVLHRMGILGAVAGLLLLASCATRPPHFRPRQVAAGQSVIYVYRPRTIVSPGPVEVFVDQVGVARLGRNRFVGVVVAPGEHLVRVQRRSEVARLVALGEGEAAYLEAGVALFGGSVSLVSQAEDVARERIAQAREAPTSGEEGDAAPR